MQIYFVYFIFYLLSRVVALVVLAYLIKVTIARLKKKLITFCPNSSYLELLCYTLALVD